MPGEPRRIRLEAVNSTVISVQWQPPLDREQNGVIRGYQIHFARVVDTTDADDMGDSPGVATDAGALGLLPSFGGMYDTMNGSVTEALLIGLQPETEYRVYVSAYTRRGDGVHSRPKRIRTKGAG